MTTLVLKRKGKASGGGQGGRPEPIPDGKYRVKITSVKTGAEVFKDDYDDIVLSLSVTQGDYAGRNFDVRVFPATEAARSLVEALGGDPDNEEAELDFAAIEGQEVNAYVGQKTKKDRTFNIVKRFTFVPKR